MIMLPALLAEIGLPVLVKAVGSALGSLESPLASGAAEALKAVDGALTQGTIPADAVAEANRHLETLATLDSGDLRTTLQEVNQTVRAEVASSDPYVRRMRPTFGYIMAVTWLVQMAAVAWVIVAEPAAAGTVISAMASLGTIWTVGLSVLGIYVYQRSEEKKVGSGVAAGTTALGDLVRKVTGR